MRVVRVGGAAHLDDDVLDLCLGLRYLGLDLLACCRLIAMPGCADDTSETVAEVNSDLTMQALTA